MAIKNLTISANDPKVNALYQAGVTDPEILAKPLPMGDIEKLWEAFKTGDTMTSPVVPLGGKIRIPRFYRHPEKPGSLVLVWGGKHYETQGDKLGDAKLSFVMADTGYRGTHVNASTRAGSDTLLMSFPVASPRGAKDEDILTAGQADFQEGAALLETPDPTAGLPTVARNSDEYAALEGKQGKVVGFRVREGDNGKYVSLAVEVNGTRFRVTADKQNQGSFTDGYFTVSEANPATIRFPGGYGMSIEFDESHHTEALKALLQA